MTFDGLPAAPCRLLVVTFENLAVGINRRRTAFQGHQITPGILCKDDRVPVPNLAAYQGGVTFAFVAVNGHPESGHVGRQRVAVCVPQLFVYVADGFGYGYGRAVACLAVHGPVAHNGDNAVQYGGVYGVFFYQPSLQPDLLPALVVSEILVERTRGVVDFQVQLLPEPHLLYLFCRIPVFSYITLSVDVAETVEVDAHVTSKAATA